ncbi:hypothetical protein HETIRDRAFT_377994, partial [Heterobasidion irregulare TC 32-1]
MASSSSSSPEISAAPYSHTPGRYHYPTLKEALEDLTSRFLLNLPEDELASLERVCFQVEQAHWFYEDFIREENSKFPSLPLKKFSEMLFAACPLLHHWDHEGAFNHFMQYKTRVPVCGAIMLNDSWDKVVLVKGWKSSSGWGFPKGKINESEAPHACAAREVQEETGYNLAGKIDPEDVIELSIREQKISLYIVPGVPEDYPFQTKTRKEISKIEWFRLLDLPTWRRGKTVPGKFYLISPFIGPLKAFISERKPRNLTRKPLKAKDLRTDQTDRRPEESGPAEDLKSISVADLNGQESSSQSSADNGDPQTPSPLYSKPSVNSDATGIQLGDLDTESVNDPALRRLLVALTSSSVRSDTSNIDRSKPQPSVPSTIVPPAVVKSHTPPEVDAAHDWSIRGPRWPTERLTDSRPHRTPSPSSSENEAPMQSSPMQSSPNTSRRTSRPASLSTRNDRTRSPAHASPPTSGTFATLSLIPSSRPTARRGSASATDLSPYLTRPSEAPAIGKRMKQLALLESVIDESSRMTPVLGFRAPAVPDTTSSHIQRPPVSYGVGTTPPPHHHARPLSVSAAQPTHPNNLSSMYNVHGPYHPQPQIFNPYNHGPPGMPGDDPFTVRPRTSNTFRPVADNLSRPLQTRASMNQAQLLSALSG